jgi:surface protein
MFYGCGSLKALDVSGFDTHDVTDMSRMFYGCGSLEALDLSGQDTVARLGFNSHDALVGLEGSGFDTGSVADMRYMFAGCGTLGQITVGDSFALLGMDDGASEGMFEGCPAAVRLNGRDMEARAWLAQASIRVAPQKGDESAQVEWLQRILKKLGCLTGSVDGDFGDMTEKALETFQADEGLAQSGAADLDTVRALCAGAARVNLDQPRAGDILAFGSYEQDGDAGNGPEAVEWIVMETDGKAATLMSLRGLYAMPYNSEAKGATWKNATLNKWLNGDFLNAAFTADQQKRLKILIAMADANPVYGTQFGGEATGKVILPGIGQVGKWLPTEADRTCLATLRAVQYGAAVDEGTGGCPWWLRTPGRAEGLAARVGADGAFDFEGAPVNGSGTVVRPVISVRLVEEQKSTNTNTNNTNRKKKKKSEESSGGSSGGSDDVGHLY